jgi:hypothetical protein
MSLILIAINAIFRTDYDKPEMPDRSHALALTGEMGLSASAAG